MEEYKVTALCFIINGVILVLINSFVFVKPQWVVGTDRWYRVKPQMEMEYKKYHFYSSLQGMVVLWGCGILSYLQVHILIILIVVATVALLLYKWNRKKEEKFFKERA